MDRNTSSLKPGPEESQCGHCKKPIFRFYRAGGWTDWEHSIEPSDHHPLVWRVRPVTNIPSGPEGS